MSKIKFLLIFFTCLCACSEIQSTSTYADDDVMAQCLLVDYPVIENNKSSEYLIQTLPKLELLHPAWKDTLQAFIRMLPPLQDGESYKLFFENKKEVGLRLVLSRGDNISFKKRIQLLDFRLGYVEINSHMMPVEIPIVHWSLLRRYCYDGFKKEGVFNEIKTRKGDYDNQYNECFIFKLEEDNSKLVFDTKEIR